MNTFINNQRYAELAGLDFNSEHIKPGKIVYSRTHCIQRQFRKLSQFPECVLVTSFSDASCTDDLAAGLPSNVIKWFSNNVETDWSRSLGGVNADEGWFVLTTKDGGCISVGYSNSFSKWSNNIWLVKVDEQGNELWNRSYGGDGLGGQSGHQ